MSAKDKTFPGNNQWRMDSERAFITREGLQIVSNTTRSFCLRAKNCFRKVSSRRSGDHLVIKSRGRS